MQTHALLLAALTLPLGAQCRECAASTLNWDWSVPSDCTSLDTLSYSRELTSQQLQTIGESAPSGMNLMRLKYSAPLPAKFLSLIVSARATGSAIAVLTLKQSIENVEAALAIQAKEDYASGVQRAKEKTESEARRKMEKDAKDAQLAERAAAQMTIKHRRESDLRRYHDEVFPKVCGCNPGCAMKHSELAFKGWTWKPESGYSYTTSDVLRKTITGTGTEVNSRQTLRAAFWTHMLFDSLGVRSAADLALLSPWMFIKGGMARDIDSSLQHLMSSFGDKSEISLTTIVHLDAYYDFNTPINAAKLIKCLRHGEGGLLGITKEL